MEKKSSSSPIMEHRYAKRTIGWLCPSSSRCKEVDGQLQRDRGRTLGTMCTREEIERGTHACKVSKLGPVEWWWNQDGKLGIAIQDPTPRVRKTDKFIVLYLFVLHSVTFLKIEHFAVCFTILWTSISVFILKHVTSSRFCLYLLNMYHFTYTFSHAHTEAHTHKHTCTISTQEKWRQPGTGAWLREAGERLC